MFKVEVNIEPKMIANLLCCGLEGGAGYWCQIDWDKSNETSDLNDVPEGYREFEHITSCFGNGNLYLKTIDDELVILNEHFLQRGLRVMMQKEPEHFSDMLNKKEDGKTGDVFIQCCVFGEVVYA